MNTKPFPVGTLFGEALKYIAHIVFMLSPEQKHNFSCKVVEKGSVYFDFLFPPIPQLHQVPRVRVLGSNWIKAVIPLFVSSHYLHFPFTYLPGGACTVHCDTAAIMLVQMERGQI